MRELSDPHDKKKIEDLEKKAAQIQLFAKHCSLSTKLLGVVSSASISADTPAWPLASHTSAGPRNGEL